MLHWTYFKTTKHCNSFVAQCISVNQLASAGLSTMFPANSEMCYVQKDWNTVLVAAHKNGLYHAKVTPNNQKEAAHATVDINLLHHHCHTCRNRSIDARVIYYTNLDFHRMLCMAMQGCVCTGIRLCLAVLGCASPW